MRKEKKKFTAPKIRKMEMLSDVSVLASSGGPSFATLFTASTQSFEEGNLAW